MPIPDLTDLSEHVFRAPAGEVQILIRQAKHLDADDHTEEAYREAREFWFREWLAARAASPGDAAKLAVNVASGTEPVPDLLPGSRVVWVRGEADVPIDHADTEQVGFLAELWILPGHAPVERVFTGPGYGRPFFHPWPDLQLLRLEGTPAKSDRQDQFLPVALLLSAGRTIRPGRALPVGTVAISVLNEARYFGPLSRVSGFRYSSHHGAVTYQLDDAPADRTEATAPGSSVVEAPDGQRVECREAAPAGWMPRRPRAYRDRHGAAVAAVLTGPVRIDRLLVGRDRKVPVVLTVTSDDAALDPARLGDEFLTELEAVLQRPDLPRLD